MKVGIATLGCKVNTYESEYWVQELEKAGYEIADFTDICDVYLINTCTVTNTSDIKSRKMIHQAKRRNPNSCVVAAGCFIEANGNYEDPDIDIYIGNQDKSKLISLLDEYFANKEPIRVPSGLAKTTFEDMFLTHFEGRCRAFVKIQDGCENFCSYCIIPYVRGKCRSKSFSKVIEEVTALVEAGYQEVVLTGIHTGNYGVDLGVSFASLLKQLVVIPGLARLRISSIEATELTDEVLAVLKSSPIIVDHLHIPLQAGSDHVLKLMNRKYTLAEYYDIIKAIREIRPMIAITTDIIVGFPGETEEDFEQTLQISKQFAFAKIHVFPYSERKGTAAMQLPQHIDPTIKKQRARQLVALSNTLEKEYATKFIGQKVEVLFETYKDGYSVGHTSNYLKVKVAQEIPPNTIQVVTLTDYCFGYCLGSLEEVLCRM